MSSRDRAYRVSGGAVLDQPAPAFPPPAAPGQENPMTGPDPTPLTQRLVQVTADATFDPQGVRPHLETPRGRAEAAVVAVLRELADEYTDLEGQWYVINPPRLRALADSIENGPGR